jgi:hypothetical protein
MSITVIYHAMSLTVLYASNQATFIMLSTTLHLHHESAQLFIIKMPVYLWKLIKIHLLFFIYFYLNFIYVDIQCGQHYPGRFMMEMQSR